jgi:hypothetical protein
MRSVGAPFLSAAKEKTRHMVCSVIPSLVSRRLDPFEPGNIAQVQFRSPNASGQLSNRHLFFSIVPPPTSITFHSGIFNFL